jgi:hypothetical protein
MPIVRGLISHGLEGQLEIAGIEQAVQQVYATGLMFSEIGAPFSSPPLSDVTSAHDLA